MKTAAKSTLRALIIVALSMLLISMIFCSLCTLKQLEGAGSFGYYTFDRELVLPNGKTVAFFESGDQYFHYYHDAEGFMLVKKDGNLYYAQNDNGRPTASSVKYTTPKFLQNNSAKMLASEINFADNPDLLTEYPVDQEYLPEPLLSNASGIEPTQVSNVVIYIIFKDDTIDLSGNPLYEHLSGQGASLSNYFYHASDGGIRVNNYFPQNGNLVYVYRAPENREYYNVEQKTTRGKREAVLLTGAVNSVSSRFDFGGANLDSNDDGYVDSVSFIVGGSSSTTWGSLLWPHSWNLASINKAYNSSAHARIGGIDVGDYSFNFTTSMTLGVLCHEFFHVLGAPDLYHYEYDFVPVGDWDIMQFNNEVPQLPLTHMRTEYLGVSQSRVGTISHNGVYSLTPTVTATDDQYFAYKIPTNVSGQYFMVEYRNNSVSSTYDSMLPDSGLIVYRIKEGVREGNKNARYHSTTYPDEVYVFRPRVASTGKETNNDTRYAVSKADIAYAALSPNSTHFSSVGATLESKPNVSYDYDTIFFVGGTNSGIIIEPLSMTNGRLEFRVQLSNADNIPNDYFNDKISLSSAELVNLSYAGASVYITASDIELSYLKDIKIKLKTSGGTVIAENSLNLGKFRTEYEQGERIFECPFVINDKGLPLDSVFVIGDITTGVPMFAELSVVDADNDEKILDSIPISDAYIGWEEVLASKAELNASISASTRITLGVRKDGTVQKSGSISTGQWAVDSYQNIISASAGLTHTLMLNAQRRVISVGSNDLGEGNVSGWTDILAIEAGYKTSYAITLQGKVYSAGDNNFGQLNVGNWTDIVAISAGPRHVVGVDKYGQVFSAGSNADGQRELEEIVSAKAVACGSGFTACLLQDGTVRIIGSLAGAQAVADWTDIVKISAGENFVIGLKSDRSVVAAGVNESGQCSVDSLRDIIDIAAGEYHAAFLREDGVVLFTGSSNEGYNATSGIGNLIYDDYVDVDSIALNVSRSTLYTSIDNEWSYALCSTTVLPTNATYKKLTYTSRDPSVATVSQNGAINAVSPGITIITAEVSGSNIISTTEIVVLPYIEPSSISFADPEITLVIGSSVELRLIYSPSDATIVGKPVYSIDKNGTAFATIDQNGVVTAGGFFGKEVTVRAYLSQNNLGYSASCKVKIVSNIKDIQIISLPTKTVYKHNEVFDVEGGRVRITYDDNTTSEQSVTMSMVSGYSPTTIGFQTITISYLDATVEFEVEVQNYVKDAVLGSPGQTEYLYEDNLNLLDVTIISKLADGSQKTLPLPAGATASGYDKTKVGTQTITLTFTLDGKSYEAEYEVVVRDVVLYITGDAITNTSYVYGEEISDTDSIIMHMASGAQRTAELSQTSVSGYNPYICGVQNVTIMYHDSVGGEMHTLQKLFTVELLGEVRVYSLDDIEGRHLYTQAGNIYYIIGVDPKLEVVYSLTNGRQIIVDTNVESNIFYSLENFDNLTREENTARIKLQYKFNRQVAGGGIVEDYAYLYFALNLYGIVGLVSIDALGDTEYLYGQTPQFSVQTIDEDGIGGEGAPDFVIYDPELTDTNQICYIYYRNSVVQKSIIIRDYVLSLAPLPDIETTYGSTINLEVYAVMAKAGSRLMDADEWQAIGLDTTKTGTAEVSVVAGEKSVSFMLTVADVITAISVITPVAATSRFGQTPDFTSSYICTMASGKDVVIAYSPDEFEISSYFDNRLLAPQTVRLTHKKTSTEFRFVVTVVNYVASIRVAQDPKTQYRFGEALSFGIVATMANGESKSIALSECTVAGYDNTRVDIEQTVTVSYGDASTTIKVFVEDTVQTLTLARPPAKRNYSFGEALLFEGGELLLTYATGDKETLKNLQLNSVTCSYNPLTTGDQTVVLSIGTASASFVVTVTAQNSGTYSLKKESPFVQNQKSIVFERTTTADELLAAVSTADYLKARIKTAGGKFIMLSDAGERILRSDDTLQIVNVANYIVFSYKLYLKGDADGNGELDENDVRILAEKLIANNYDKDMTDFDGDGFFTLTDLINWARKCAEPKAPLNELATNFISDIKPKRKEELI